MKRTLAFALFFSLAASLPLLAQRGGGHGGGGSHAMSGGHGGFSSHGSFGGHAAGGHGFSGVGTGAGFGAHSFHRGSSRSAFSSRGFNRNRNFRFRTNGLRSNCNGFRCNWGYGYPWAYSGFYDPYWWDSGSSYDEDQESQIGVANEMNQQSLDDQRTRQPGDQDSYVRSAPARHQEERTEAAPATVLVFRDQHKQEVRNYAIVGQTLWNFAPQHTEKIPLTDLDLSATTKANDDRGVSFRLPGAGEGQ